MWKEIQNKPEIIGESVLDKENTGIKICEVYIRRAKKLITNDLLVWLDDPNFSGKPKGSRYLIDLYKAEA